MREHKRLLLLPAVAGTGLALLVGALVLLELRLGASGGSAALGVAGIVLVVCLATFLSAVLICAADDALRGQPVSIAAGCARAVRRLPALLAWAVLGSLLAAVGSLLDRVPVVGLLLEKVFGIAVGLLSYLVLPAMTIDGLGVLAALQQTGKLLRHSGGQQIRGTIWIYLPVFLALLPAAVVVVLGVESDNQVLALAALAGAAAWMALAVTLAVTISGIFRTMLYHDGSNTLASSTTA